MVAAFRCSALEVEQTLHLVFFSKTPLISQTILKSFEVRESGHVFFWAKWEPSLLHITLPPGKEVCLSAFEVRPSLPKWNCWSYSRLSNINFVNTMKEDVKQILPLQSLSESFLSDVRSIYLSLGGNYFGLMEWKVGGMWISHNRGRVILHLNSAWW